MIVNFIGEKWKLIQIWRENGKTSLEDEEKAIFLLEKTEDYSSNTNKSVAGNVKPQALMKILLNWQMAK